MIPTYTGRDEQQKFPKKSFSNSVSPFLPFSHGYTESFYKTPLVYFDYGGHTYWHLGIIINRCLHDDTFSRRKRDERLPPFTPK